MRKGLKKVIAIVLIVGALIVAPGSELAVFRDLAPIAYADAEELVWHYKVEDGIGYKRLYNTYLQQWVTGWMPI